MAGRFAPAHGADSAEGRSLLTFRVLMDCHDGGRTEQTVYAMGRHSAKDEARHAARARGYDPEAVVRVEQIDDPATEYADTHSEAIA